MRAMYLAAAIAAVLFIVLISQTGCNTKAGETKTLSQEEMIARGKYLVDFGGCHDCHSPKVYTEMGPVPDTTRLLAGHFDDEVLPPSDTKMVEPGKWVMTEKNFTAWVGPWGISYSANLTPDKATGIGALSEEMFIKTLREGKWMGTGRPLLPPMPWPGIGSISDEDLKCIYSYLMSIKTVHNEVPQPVPPNEMESKFAKN